MKEIIESGADFNVGKTSRLALWRIWDKSLPSVMIIGLNPSTANETKNDNTITKVIKVADYNGYGGVYMLNLFSQITAYPKELSKHKFSDIDNSMAISKYEKLCEKTIFAWGNFEEAIEEAKWIIARTENPYCFKQNKNGSPKHPLYCPDTTLFIPFNK